MERCNYAFCMYMILYMLFMVLFSRKMISGGIQQRSFILEAPCGSV